MRPVRDEWREAYCLWSVFSCPFHQNVACLAFVSQKTLTMYEAILTKTAVSQAKGILTSVSGRCHVDT